MAIKVAILDIFGFLQRKKIGFLELDCVTSEDITMSSNVTQSPIETGESITDHVYNEPLQLRIEAIVSDSDPVRQLRRVLNIVPNTDPRFVIPRLDAYESLRDLWKGKAPVDVVTGLELFSNMLVTNISIPRTVEDGNSLRFTVDMIQIETKDSVFQNNKSKRSNVGRKQGAIANNSVEKVAGSVLDKLKGVGI
jgi:hypothetical protein